MTTLSGIMPSTPGEELPCVWCGLPTDIRFVPPAHPELGPLPLNILCAGALILAYERLLRGEALSPQDMERMQRLADHAGGSSPRLAAIAQSSSADPGTTKASGR
jgi:hypothetical protein